MAFTACGVTSLPMPSPEMTAIFFVALTGRKYHKAVAIGQWPVVGGQFSGNGARAFVLITAPCPLPCEVLRYNQRCMSLAAKDEIVVGSADLGGDLRREFQALISGCGIYRLDRAQIVLTGCDRLRWLNGM